jgi:hypothetical protein
VLRHGELPDAGGSRPRLTYVLPAAWAGVVPALTRAEKLRFHLDLDLDRHPGSAVARRRGQGR